MNGEIFAVKHTHTLKLAHIYTRLIGWPKQSIAIACAALYMSIKTHHIFLGGGPFFNGFGRFVTVSEIIKNEINVSSDLRNYIGH